MRKARILIVDDEPGILEVCKDTLEYLDEVEIHTEQESLVAARRLAEESFDLLLTDLRMPRMSGVELLQEGRKADPDLPALIVTAFPTVESAVETMKLGAVDYITKPFLPDELLLTTKRLLESRKLKDEVRLLRRQVERTYSFKEIVGESEAMQRVFGLIHKVAQSDVDVLITGETGTGKELVARSIHQRSRRSKGRFVPVDCGAIPENLLESEFFGYEKGAFTGATTRSIGLMEFAYGGSFFLDELGELPLQMQAKLLRVLQERKVRRLGGKDEHAIDLRVIAATRQNIDRAVFEGRFREDLFFRINVVRIEIPPLRQREGDIPLLIEYFLDKHKREAQKEIEGFAQEALDILCAYHWPGNVRELQNAVRHAIALVDQPTIQPFHLPRSLLRKNTPQTPTPQAPTSSDTEDAPVRSPSSSSVASELTRASSEEGGPFSAKELVSFGAQLCPEGSFSAQRDQLLAAFEEQFLKEQLAAHSGEVTAAAKAADIPRGTFYRLMKKYDLHAKTFRS